MLPMPHDPSPNAARLRRSSRRAGGGCGSIVQNASFYKIFFKNALELVMEPARLVRSWPRSLSRALTYELVLVADLM